MLGRFFSSAYLYCYRQWSFQPFSIHKSQEDCSWVSLVKKVILEPPNFLGCMRWCRILLGCVWSTCSDFFDPRLDCHPQNVLVHILVHSHTFFKDVWKHTCPSLLTTPKTIVWTQHFIFMTHSQPYVVLPVVCLILAKVFFIRKKPHCTSRGYLILNKCFFFFRRRVIFIF